MPDYLANSANTASSSNNILNKLAPYESIPNGHSSLEDYNSPFEKNSFVPSTNLRERRKGNNHLDSSDSPQKSNNFYERQLDDQSQYDQLYSHKGQLIKHHHHHNQPRDNEFASNSLLESVSSPMENGQDFGYGNNFLSSNDFGGNSNYNADLSALSGLRSLNALSALNPLALNGAMNPGMNNGYSNLSPLAASSSSIVGTLGGSLNGLNGLGSVVPPGAIVGAPGSSPPPGMKLAGYVTVTNPSPNIGSIPSASNLLASPATQQQMLFNQVMNRSPQAQALAQVMAQSMAQGIRIPFANPYANNFQLLTPANLNGISSTSPSNSGSKNSNSGNSNNKDNSNSDSNNSNNNLSNGGEQQFAASSTNRAKFLQRLNPMNLFRRLRTRNQKNNSKQNNKDQSGTNSNEINNSIPDLEDRSQFFLPADLLLGSASTTNQQLPQLTLQQQQLAEQLSAQLAQLNMQLAQQSNHKAKFLRKMGTNNQYTFANAPSSTTSGTFNVKKVAKRDLSNQLNQSSPDEQVLSKHSETILYSLGNDAGVRENSTNGNDTEVAENAFFPVADIYQNYKFNIRPRFRFPSSREQRRISNSHDLHVNTNNFLTSSSMKSNFVGLMGSRNYEVIAGGILNNEGHRNTDHSMLHGMHHSNNNHNSANHKLPHHHQNQRNMGGHLMPNKGNKFNIDNDFDDDEDSEEDDHSFNGPVSQGNANQRNGNVMFLDDLFGSNMQNGKNNGGMLGFQGFNSFNALSSASSYHQLNNSTDQQIENNAAQSTDLVDIKSVDNSNQTSKV